MDVQRPRASQAFGPLVPAGRQAGWLLGRGPGLLWKPLLVTGAGCGLMRVPCAECPTWAFRRVPFGCVPEPHLLLATSQGKSDVLSVHLGCGSFRSSPMSTVHHVASMAWTGRGLGAERPTAFFP